MGRAGDDEIQVQLSFPEEFPVQIRVVEQQLIVIQQVLGIRIPRHIICIADIFLIAHSFGEFPPAVEGRVVIVEGLGGVPFFPQ